MYESPSKLSPAEIGYLYDTKISKNELVGTLFNLEDRKIISISSSGKLKQINDSIRLSEFEEYICSLVRRGTLTSINEKLDSTIYQTFSSMVRESLVSSEYMQDNLLSGFISSSLKIALRIYIVSVVTFIAYWFITAYYFHALDFALGEYGKISILVILMFIIISATYFILYIIAGAILTLIFVKINGTIWIGTKKLKKIWNDIEGYKIYIRQAQLDRLKFENNEIKKASNEKDFAYAVALGMNINWKNRFK